MTNSKGAIALVDKFQKGDRLWLRKSKKGRSHFVTNSKRAMPLVEKKQERAIALCDKFQKGDRLGFRNRVFAQDIG
ncbi:hypothetical protein QUB40_17080 [Microcoleus sp. AT9_A2]|uniref:hypothetical protein n=1 Tax=Microcoleus sp. AT9_A2 TaxID=2818624 RepID=UPI002FCEFC57